MRSGVIFRSELPGNDYSQNWFLTKTIFVLKCIAYLIVVLNDICISYTGKQDSIMTNNNAKD